MNKKKKEPTKKEIEANFEQTLRKIKDLPPLSNQREKLLETIETLDAVEVARFDDAEETNLNHFEAVRRSSTRILVGYWQRSNV